MLNRESTGLEWTGVLPFPFADTAFSEGGPVFSPDGRYLAYVSDESGQNEVYVQPYPGPGQKHPVSMDGGSEPSWSADGRELFYRQGNGIFAVDIELEPNIRLGQPKMLFQGDYRRSPGRHANYDVSDDGRFVMVERGELSAPTQFNVVLNWFQELKRLVPR